MDMKRNLILTVLLATIMCASAQQPSIIENVLATSVEDKIQSIQKLIGFDDGQAKQLKEAELSFLLEVNKAEHCFLCNKAKRIEKLKRERDAALQQILTREQYIKYDAIPVNRINTKIPIQVRK